MPGAPVSACSRLEIVEVGGRGGVFQHAFAVAQLTFASGRPVRLHTARDHEELGGGVSLCHCFDWHRSRGHARNGLVVLGFLTRTVPHLVRVSRRNVVWVQGTFKPLLTAVLLLALKLSGCPTVFSPHNLFSRRGRVDAWLIDICIRLADHVVAYNDRDHKRLGARRLSAHRLTLVQLAGDVSIDAVETWRKRLPSDRPAVCSLGQIRADKNLPLLVEAAALAGVALVVVGPDAGALADARRRAAEVDADVLWHIGYQPLHELGAVLRATGVVVCPYAVASQSGVAALARAHGAVVVASDVGALEDQADILIDELEPEAVARAIQLGVTCPRPTGSAQTASIRSEIDDLLAAVAAAAPARGVA